MQRDLSYRIELADRAGLALFPSRNLDAERLTYAVSATQELEEEDRTLAVVELQRRGWR